VKKATAYDSCSSVCVAALGGLRANSAMAALRACASGAGGGTEGGSCEARTKPRQCECAAELAMCAPCAAAGDILPRDCSVLGACAPCGRGRYVPAITKSANFVVILTSLRQGLQEATRPMSNGARRAVQGAHCGLVDRPATWIRWKPFALTDVVVVGRLSVRRHASQCCKS
jgi:hypothetical protein